MQKLSLNLADLKVESFETSKGNGENGTVFGQLPETDTRVCDSREINCELTWETCEPTICPISCQPTCYDSCQPTCGYTCHTCVTVCNLSCIDQCPTRPGLDPTCCDHCL